MTSYDFQQYYYMLEVLKTLNINDLDTIGHIVQELNSSLSQVQNQEQEWIDRFTKQWWKLEEVYALNIYENREHLNEEDRAQVGKAIEGLKDLLETEVGRLVG